ncbi:MAG: hypothetical protein H6707_04725 [Deltaproteobacteria bacterium]|nr:hypothetical protein [Deltaproteobacteria bacterium]
MFGKKAYTAEGLHDAQQVNSYQDHLVNIYGECGVSPTLTATVGLAPIGYAKAGSESTSYVGPLSAGLRLGLKREGRLRLAISASYSFAPPVGDRVLDVSPIIGANGNSSQAIYQPTVENHAGQLQFELGLAFGNERFPSFFSASIGPRFNSASTVDHALVGVLQVGTTFWRRLSTIINVSVYEPFFQPVTVSNTSGAGQTRYMGMGMTVSYWLIDALAILANFEGVFYAESNAATPSLSFGLESKFQLF